MSNPAVAFGWQLYVQLLKLGSLSGDAGGFFSPLSVYLALALVLNGAGPVSQTQRELWAALDNTQLPANSTLPNLLLAEASFNNQTLALVNALVSQSSKNGTEIGIANGIWAKQLPVRQEFADQMWKLYRTPVKSVNNTDPINAWAKAKTGGRITQAVPPGAAFDLLITNAVYFRAVWEYSFDPEDTMPQPFTTLVNGTEEVTEADMMYKMFKPSDMTGAQVLYANMPGRFRAVKLPYKGSTMSAYAVLPDKGKYKLDVDAAAADLTPQLLFNKSNWRTVYSIGRLEVSLPKFKSRVDQVPLKKALMALGITAAFNPDAADFGRISDEPLFISSVLQSAVVLVDEKGTEAAALTSLVMTTTAYVEYDTPPLMFDRPFMFLIVDEASKVILFQGTVKDPSRSIS